MESDAISTAINVGLQKLSFNGVIRINQRKVIESYLKGRDVLFCSPIGIGKSLTFEIAPFVLKHFQNIECCMVLVISPLTSLMRTQTQTLNMKGVKAVFLTDLLKNVDCDIKDKMENLNLEDVKEGKIDILFSSPESLLGNNRNLLLDLAKKKIIKAVFADEAHCIKKFGLPDKKKKKSAYRPIYGRLNEIRSIVGGHVPMIALTATATEETKAMIIKHLCMENCTDIFVNPDKLNVTYWVHSLQSDDICENFKWLIPLLRENKNATSRMIIFFRQIKHMSELYEYLETTLQRDAYVNYNEDGPNDDRNRLFDMFHMKTDDDVKDSICSSYMNTDGNIRVVLCSTSFSMGLDVKGVDTVIHYGPANDIDDYLQESGRAGRDPSHKCNAIILNYKRSLGSQNITTEMKNYVKSKTCRRQILLNAFKASIEHSRVSHFCCDICRSLCKCACECENECICTNTCMQEIPSIYNTIISKVDDLDSNDSESEECADNCEEYSSSTDSEVENVLMRTPQVIHSSDDEMF